MPILLLSYIALEPNVRYTDQHIQVTNCKISQTSCTIKLDKQTNIKFNILPRGISETDILSITADIQGVKIDKAAVVFEGIEINTTTPEYPLYQKNDTHFSGKGFLVVCSLSKMNWLAHFIVTKNNQTWKISFPFEKIY